MAMEMTLQSISGTITYQEKMKVLVQEPIMVTENSVDAGRSDSYFDGGDDNWFICRFARRVAAWAAIALVRDKAGLLLGVIPGQAAIDDEGGAGDVIGFG
jgi:hypothetical protein